MYEYIEQSFLNFLSNNFLQASEFCSEETISNTEKWMLNFCN